MVGDYFGGRPNFGNPKAVGGGSSGEPIAYAPLAGTESLSIDLGARNGELAQRAYSFPVTTAGITNLFGNNVLAAAGALAIRVHIQPGGLNVDSGAYSNTIGQTVLGAGTATTPRSVTLSFYAGNASTSAYRKRFCWFGKDHSSHLLGNTSPSNALRTPDITPYIDEQGGFTGLIILSFDGTTFAAKLALPDGTVVTGDSFAPALWKGITSFSNGLFLGSNPNAPVSHAAYFSGSFCQFVQLDGAAGTDAEWGRMAQGESPTSIWPTSLAAYYRMRGPVDLAQTAGSRGYPALTAVGSGHKLGTGLRPALQAGNGLFAKPLNPGYLHALDPADVRAVTDLAGLQALTGTISRDVEITGAATHVQARAVRLLDDAVVKNWTRVTTSAATGVVPTLLPGVPVGRHRIEYRREDDPSVVSVVNAREGVGVVAALMGQSQMRIALAADSVEYTPSATTDVSFNLNRASAKGAPLIDAAMLTAPNQLSDAMVALAAYWDELASGVPLEIVGIAEGGTSTIDLMYHYNGNGLDMIGDGVDPASGNLTAIMLSKRKRVTLFAFSWATSDTSTRNGGAYTVTSTPWGSKALTERPWVERMNELFGGVEKSTADATERSQRSNIADLGLLAWRPWVVMLPCGRHADGSNVVAASGGQYGDMRRIQYEYAELGTGRDPSVDATFGGIQIDTFIPDGGGPHQSGTDVRGNVQFGLRIGQAIAHATKASGINPRSKFVAASGAGTSTLTVSTSLPNGGALITGAEGATIAGFEVNEAGGGWTSSGFTASIDGDTVKLVRDTGTWNPDCKLRYLDGWPLAIGSTSSAAEKVLLDGILYESRADAVPSMVTGLTHGVPLMPTFSDIVAE